jgi:hypothetical protein
MTSRQRLLAALRGEPTDRVPIWGWGIQPWLPQAHPSVQAVVDAYLNRGDILHWWYPGADPFLTASPEVAVTSRRRPSSHPDYEEHVKTFATPRGTLEEVNYVSLQGKPGYRRKYLLETEEDMRRLLSVPYLPPRPDCSSFFRLTEELGERGLLIVNMPSDPMYFVNNLLGSETFALWSVEKRALIDALIAEFELRLRAWVEWVIGQGAGPLFGYVGPELCIPPLQSPADFGRWVEGPDRRINDLIHQRGGLVLVHCHGRMGPVLEGFARMRADALHPIEPPPMGDVTLAEAKRRVGQELCLVGNIQEHDIWTMPTSQFRVMVADTVETGMAGGRFILSPTATPFGWPYLSDLARDNWLALLEVGLEAGRG